MLTRVLIMVVLFLFAVPNTYAYYNSYPKITQMEKNLYKQSFESQDIYQRLGRIEQSLYNSVQSNKSLSERVDGIANKLQISSMPGYLLNDIQYLEKINFQQLYNNDSPDNRLERLEYHIVGAIQDGNYKDRIAKLKTLNKRQGIDRYFDNQSQDIYASNDSNEAPEGYYRQREMGNGSKWDRVQETLMMFAPIILGIL